MTDTGTDLAHVPPETSWGYKSVLWKNNFLGIVGEAGTWTDTTTDPTYEQCTATIGQRGLSVKERQRITFSEGRGFCMTAADAQFGYAIAFARFKELDGEAVIMDVIRWDDLN